MRAARLGVLTALLLGLLLALGLAPAGATTGTTVLAQEGGEAVRGTLKDASNENAPVPGILVRATSADGSFEAEATSDQEGAWQIDLPGPGDYTIAVDVDSLTSADVGLAEGASESLDVNIRSGQTRTIIFRLGDSGATGGKFLDRFASKAADGILFGLIIAMTAIGLSLIFGTTGLVNFAHGELVSLGAILAWWLNSPNHLGGKLFIVPAALIAIVVAGGFGGALELGLWRPLRRRRTGLIQMLVISIGLSLLLRNILLMMFGGDRQPLFDFTIQKGIEIGPLLLTPRDLWVALISVLTLIGVATMLQKTRIGKAMRAVSDNRDLAESSGIDVQRVVLFVWVLGGGLAALGGVLFGLDQTVDYLMGFRLLLLMFAGIILGGLGTAYGAMLGSLIVGLITELSTLWFPAELKTAWALAALVVILIVRPQGLLGRKERFG